MKILNEESYETPENLREAKTMLDRFIEDAEKLAKTYEGNPFQYDCHTPSQIEVMETLFRRQYLTGVYIYTENGGWFCDVRVANEDGDYVSGTPSHSPLKSKMEAEKSAIQLLAIVLAYEDGNCQIVDKSNVKEGCTDFRLYNDRFNIPLTMVEDFKDHLSNNYPDVYPDNFSYLNTLNDARQQVHDEMAKKIFSRDGQRLIRAVLVLLCIDIHSVPAPIGWNGASARNIFNFDIPQIIGVGVARQDDDGKITLSF